MSDVFAKQHVHGVLEFAASRFKPFFIKSRSDRSDHKIDRKPFAKSVPALSL